VEFSVSLSYTRGGATENIYRDSTLTDCLIEFTVIGLGTVASENSEGECFQPGQVTSHWTCLEALESWFIYNAYS